MSSRRSLGSQQLKKHDSGNSNPFIDHHCSSQELLPSEEEIRRQRFSFEFGPEFEELGFHEKDEDFKKDSPQFSLLLNHKQNYSSKSNLLSNPSKGSKSDCNAQSSILSNENDRSDSLFWNSMHSHSPSKKRHVKSNIVSPTHSYLNQGCNSKYPEISFVPYDQQTRHIECLKGMNSSGNSTNYHKSLSGVVIHEEQEDEHCNNEPQEAEYSNEFSSQERESLKNAFRYICRLVFKESSNHQKVIEQIAQRINAHSPQTKQHRFELSRAKRKKQKVTENISENSGIEGKQESMNDFGYLFREAELISGERYFQKYLAKLSAEEQAIVLEYMIWFLEFKYLRYINRCSNENKGKRKQMKKELYLKFKNLTMLPYLHLCLKNARTEFSAD